MITAAKELANKIKSSKDADEACRILVYEAMKEEPLSEGQFGVLKEIFGSAELASYALLHLHSTLTLPDIKDLNLVYTELYDKFVHSSPESVAFLNSPIPA